MGRTEFEPPQWHTVLPRRCRYSSVFGIGTRACCRVQAEGLFRAAYSIVAAALVKMGLPPARLSSLEEHAWRLPDVISNFAHELQAEIEQQQLHGKQSPTGFASSEVMGCVGRATPPRASAQRGLAARSGAMLGGPDTEVGYPAGCCTRKWTRKASSSVRRSKRCKTRFVLTGERWLLRRKKWTWRCAGCKR